MGLIFETVDWQRQSTNPHNSHTSGPANAPEGTSELVGIKAPPQLSAGEDCALRHQPSFQITPQGNRQLACDGNDHNSPYASALPLSSPLEP